MNSGNFVLWQGGGIGGYHTSYEGQVVFCQGKAMYVRG